MIDPWTIIGWTIIAIVVLPLVAAVSSSVIRRLRWTVRKVRTWNRVPMAGEIWVRPSGETVEIDRVHPDGSVGVEVTSGFGFRWSRVPAGMPGYAFLREKRR